MATLRTTARGAGLLLLCVLTLGAGLLILTKLDLDPRGPLVAADGGALPLAVLAPEDADLVDGAETPEGPAAEESAPEEEAPRGRAVVEGAAGSAVPILWRGTCVDPDGEPVPDARLVLRSTGDSAQATTGEDGAFALDWTSGAQARLEVLHDDYTDLRRPWFLPTEEPTELVLARSSTIEGRAISQSFGTFEGARAMIWYSDSRSRDPLHEVEIDGEGRFRFTGLDGGEYAVGAHLADGPLAYVPGVVLNPGEVESVSLDLVQGSTLRGRVVQRDGRGVADVKLSVLPRNQGMSRSVSQVVEIETTSGKDGSYVLRGLSPGRSEVQLEATWGGESREWVEVAFAGEVVDKDLRIRAPTTVSGIVLAPDGTPVAGARVVSGKRGRSSFSFEAIRGLRADASGVLPTAVTDERGRFFLEDLPERLSLVVAALPPGDMAGDLAPAYQDVYLRTDRPQQEVELVLQPGIALAGRVTDVANEPLAEARVTVEYTNGRSRTRWGRYTTDEDGRFELRGLVAGQVQVTASAEEHDSERARVELSLDAPADEVLLELRPTVHLYGWVTDADGNAVAGASVRADPNPRTQDGVRLNRESDRTDEFGRFEFDDLLPGHYRLSASAVGWERTEDSVLEIDVPEQVAPTLLLRPAPRLERALVRGEVSRMDTGLPPEDLRFYDYRGGVVTVDGGRFTIQGMSPGNLALRVQADGCLTRTLPVTELAPGSDVNLGNVQMEPATRMIVRLVDADGQPVRGASVYAQPLPPSEGGRAGEFRNLRLRETRTRGEYELDKMPRGKWRLRVRHRSYETLQRPLQVRERARQTLRLELKAR